MFKAEVHYKNQVTRQYMLSEKGCSERARLFAVTGAEGPSFQTASQEPAG